MRGAKFLAAACAAVLAAACLLVAAADASAHDPKGKKLGATKAQADLDAGRASMDAAKKKLAAAGNYSCCTKPSCDTCARVNGSCACAENVKAGKGACGECVEGWKAGRGAVDGVKADDVKLLASDHQAHHGASAPPPELDAARERLNAAKRTLVEEEVETVHRQILDHLEKTYGAKQRF